MEALTLRAQKGSPLAHSEMDGNWVNIQVTAETIVSDLEAEIAARIAGDATEIIARDAAILVETNARTTSISDEIIARNNAIFNAVANAINSEVYDRNIAINTAITTEVNSRNTAITNAINEEVINRDSAILIETNARIESINNETTNRNIAIALSVQNSNSNEVEARNIAIAEAIAIEVTDRENAIGGEIIARNAADVIILDSAKNYTDTETTRAISAEGTLVPKTTTVNGHNLSTNVIVTASDVGLGNVNNTSDVNKPVSTSQAGAITAAQTAAATDATSKANAALTAAKLYSDLETAARIADISDEVIERNNAIDVEATNRVIGDNNTLASAKTYTDAETTRSLAAEGTLVPKLTTVNGYALTENIVLTAIDVGLGSVGNISPTNMPVSIAQAAADALVQSNAATDATTKANAAQAASAPLEHVGDVGAAHGEVTTTVNGFMLATDKVKINSIADNAAALTGTAPLPLAVTASIGVGTYAARSDHQHPFPVKSEIELGNVDNTSDINKPVSTAQSDADTVIQMTASSDASAKANAALTSAKAYTDVETTARIAAINAEVTNRNNAIAAESVLRVNAEAAVLTSAKIYSDGLILGLWDDRGNYDASVNTFPDTGGSGTDGAVLKGDIWTASVAGTLGGVPVAASQFVRATTDAPGQIASNWAIGLANTDIDNSITAGVTGRSASQDAIKTALNLKANLANPTFTGTVIIPEGTSTNPGLAFSNDDAADTGFYHIADGSFGATCNAQPVINFTTFGVDLLLTPTAPTPAVGTNTTQIANTAFTLAQIANDAPTKTGSGASGSWAINSATATKLASAKTIGATGDIVWTSPAFDGSGHVTAVATLPVVNSNVGSFGDSSHIPIVTVNAKGQVTGVTTQSVNIVSALSGLSDVNLTALVNNNVLKYNSATGKWVNSTISAAEVGSYTKAEVDTLLSALSTTLNASIQVAINAIANEDIDYFMSQS